MTTITPRATCLERQVGFSEIDLRWGVSEEEFKNGATVEICLKEIDRCRDFPPFFVGFLGERYGWVPKHDELAAYWGKRTKTDNDVKPAEHKSESIKSDLEYANTIRASCKNRDNFYMAISSVATALPPHGGQNDRKRSKSPFDAIGAIAALPAEFTLAQLELACPGVSRDMVRRVLNDEKGKTVECIGRGPGAKWQKKG